MNLTIKNIPPDVYEEFKQTAAERGRSLNAEIIQSLSAQAQELARRRRMRKSRPELERFLAKLPAMTSSVRLIREERERR